jgi:triosephosphate isomerase (TIM)
VAKYLVGNWKMHGDAEYALEYMLAFCAEPLLEELPNDLHIITCPPAIWLHQFQTIVAGTKVKLGGQDCHFAMSGAFTGDISAEMLRDAGCDYVIVGHSERRSAYFENDATVAHKANAALLADLQPIICVGETKEQRDDGEHIAAIQAQIKILLAEIIPHHSLIIAYEPIWAIGTGHTPTTDEISEMFEVIINECRRHGIYLVNLLYGGSVRPENAEELFKVKNLSGLLVGNASTQLKQWTEIIKAAIR